MKAGHEARPYRVEAKAVPSGQPETWATSLVTIFAGAEPIGEYARNHSGWADSTFEPFEIQGKWYALYSRNYTGTRVMSLPDCRDLGGEENDAGGFCPVEYFVPRFKPTTTTFSFTDRASVSWAFEVDAEGHQGVETYQHGNHTRRTEYGDWQSLDIGFVAGCIWGDDSSWKVQTIDLSRAAEGLLVRAERFGHLQLPGKCSLSEAIRLDHHPPDWDLRATITEQRRWDVRTGELIDPYDE